MSGTQSFTITAGTTNSVLIVNYTEVAQTNANGDAATTITWNGTPLTRAISQVSGASSNIYAEIFYLFNPTPAVNGSLSVTGSGRTGVFNAYTLSNVNPYIPPTTYGHDSSNGTSSVTLSSATVGGSFADIAGGFRLGSSASLGYFSSTGPAVTRQWGPFVDASPIMGTGAAYISNLNTGAVTISQTNNATSRNEIAVAVFSAVPAGESAWSVAGGGSWNLAGNWGGTIPTGTGAAAWFTPNNPTTSAIVTLDAAITLNSLLLANSNQITIAAGSSGGNLTFAASGNTLPLVTVVSGSQIISAPVSLNASTAFAVSNSQSLTISGNIADGSASSGISVPTGTLILGGNNSYSGTTSVTGGALNVTGNLGNTPIFLSGGTLSLQSAGAVNQNVLTVKGGALVETASNAISGSAALFVTNGATVTLSQANNYSGATTANNGILTLATPASIYAGNTANWTPGNISVSGSATLAVNYGGPNDFNQSQAGTLLTNLSASTSSSGLASGAVFGFDTSNATAAVTYSAPIADTTAGPLTFNKRGAGTLVLSGTNSYSGQTLTSNGELILTGANTALAGTMSTLRAVNTAPLGTTVLSIRNAAVLGSGTANSSLAPITLNATGGTLSASILEIGAKIGTDPGPYNADFSYQVVAPGNGVPGGASPTNVVAVNGQINLGFLGNSNDGTGFAALTPSTTSLPRVVALYSASATSTLATLGLKSQFGQGAGDHLTMGSPTANNTVVLMNPVDFVGGPQRRWASIRGVGIVPEGEYAGAIINSQGGSNNVSFDGNGGLIFDSAATTYTAASLQINGGAVFVAANDPAAPSTPGALGEGVAPIQVGTSTTNNPSGGTPVPTVSSANIAFMTYGPNAGIGSIGVITNRNINVGGSDVTYANATLGGMSDDWTQMNGAISLNEPPTIPTTFTARNGGRVDFGGTISGSGSIVVGNSIVEGDAATPGIAVNNNGTIVFNGATSYTGSTTVSAGKLYVNGSITASSLVTVASGATLGGTGSISSPVNISTGGILEGGQSGTGALTLNGNVTFNGSASVYFGGTLPAVGNPELLINGILNTNSNAVAINCASISSTGYYALINYSGVQTSPSNSFTLGELPNRAQGTLVVNGTNSSELDLHVTSLAAFIRWTGATNGVWDTTTFNWTIPPSGPSTHYIDSPGDAVVFDDSAAPHTVVTISGTDVHPSSVTFNNNTSTYTISGSNAIAGSTGLQLTGTGTVVLLNTNTFTGATSIGAGATLQLGNGAPGSDGSITESSGIADNGTLAYNLAGVQSYGGEISGTGSLALQSGMLTLTGSNSYAGATTVSSGTLQLGTGAVGKDGSLASSNIANNGTLLFNYFGSGTYAGTISGSGAVTKSGLGTLTLAGSNTYSAPTQLNGGTLQLANQGALQNSTLNIGQFASLTFFGGVNNFNIGGLTGGGGISLTDTNTTSVALTVGGNVPNATYSGAISGIGSLTQAGSNSLTLSGTSSYSGGTTISAGTLAITNANSLGAVGGQLSIGPATLEVAGNIASGRNIVFTDPASTIRVDASQSYNNTGTLSGNNLTKTGAGLLILGGTSSVAFATVVNGGTLLANGPFMTLGTVNVSGSSVFGGNGSADTTTVLNGGTIDVSANNGSALSLSGLILGQTPPDKATMNFRAANPGIPQLAIGVNGLTANGGNNSVTVNVIASGALIGTYTLATYSGPIGGTAGSSAFVLGSQTGLNARDQGALLITSSAIDYVITGNYPIWSGIHGSNWVTANNWVLNNTGGSQTTFLPGDTVVFDDSAGTTIGGTTNVTISGTGDVSPGSVTFNNNAYNYTISGPYGITGSGALNVNGTGSVTISSTNTYTAGTNINAGTLIAANTSGAATGIGPVNINAGGLLIANNSGGNATGSGPLNINGGTLQVGNGDTTGTLGTVPLDNGVLVFNRSDSLTYAGAISGSGSVLQHGPGLLTLTATNAYSGGTVVNGGTLAIGKDANLGAVPASVQPANIYLNASTLQFNAGTLLPTPTAANSFTINTNRGITLGPAGATINVNFVSTTQTFNNETAVFYAGVIAGSGGLTITGSGGWNTPNQSIVNLTGNNTYGGGTTVNNAVLAFADNGGPYTSILPATTVLNLVNSGAFNIDAGASTATVAGLTGDPTGLVGTCNGSALVGLIIDSTGNYTYNGVISAFTYVGKTGHDDRIALTMSGSGSETLTGASTYAGGTTVSSGTLVLGNNAAIGTGGLTANGGVTDLHGFNPTVSSFSGSAGLVTNNGASDSLLTVSQGATPTTFGGTISNGPTNKVALNLTTSGTGALVLTGSNTYSGATTINGGSTLQLGDSGNSGSVGNSVVTDNGSLIVSRSDSVNLTSLISGPLNGSGSLKLNGGGTLTLTGTNGYSGGTVVDGGTMIVTNPAAIADGTSLTVGDAVAFPAPVVPAPPAGASAATVPEPGSLLLLVAGSAVLIGLRRLRQRRM
jgi:autotransporter-associated beta strand protein